ncbi:hypothetical protein [Sphingobacterium sp. SYP-B4668]|uniref:hypothetical protein n=1 Tax=Sphingobacterium sp. SYP-B4668 TaxID=2996035 RepID=UPI0022DCEB2E|nr:hypothetical protein [Sphingobacterium sp. SYP-B4668]
MSLNQLSETQICGFSLDKDTINFLKHKNIDVFNGSLGQITNLEYRMYSSTVQCLPNLKYPSNFHEYEIAILDLINTETVDYNFSDHQRKVIDSTSDLHIVCHHPQNIFDPRAFSLMMLEAKLKNNLSNGFLIICFCGEPKNTTYHFNDLPKAQYDLYSFIDSIPEVKKQTGRRVQISTSDRVMHRFLSKYNDTITYHATFRAPKTYVKDQYTLDPSYVPLVHTNNGELVSYYHLQDNSGVFFFPDIENKGAFLEEFITQIAPTYLPNLFPGIVKKNWLNESRYSLPNQEKLLKERELLKEKFEKALDDKDDEIVSNQSKYTFLQDLITETDDKLVHALVVFLKWLGFSNVMDADTIEGRKLKEEDVLIENENGIILIETKGIGGTSKDDECSQVGKIKARRQSQRKKFDVMAHYIVNHQRHLPAEKRQNPPFTPHQISDAEYDSRGLITTWQLFNLYFAIEDGIISKEEARLEFEKTGYIDFIPDSWIQLNKPKEYYKENTVVVIELQENTTIKKGDYLVILKNGKFEQYKIISIQLNGSNVEEVTSGEIGLKLDGPLPKNVDLYLKSK